MLEIHGGPNGRFSDSFDITHQVLTGAGYIVLAVNPRGSSSYGPDFLKAVLCDWGGEDFLDLMAAVDELCKRPYIDTNRLGLHGYSYGGFMSSWIVGHDHRFKAAIVGAPCINLHSMYGTSDIGVSFGENQWGGSSVGDIDILFKHSPLTYATEVQTPVLLMHGEVDYRCPIEQSEQFFIALKRQNKTVEFVRFPNGAHGFRKNAHPTFRSEYLQRMLDWLNHYV
ncbi:MAG: S9 family peptidase [Candidatus Latescibacteria bacterium]|nr:S9 family peptidase [Candidatus Latescibacterota bacterium]